MLWRVKQGCSHYLRDGKVLVKKVAGDKLELLPHQVLGFLDKLEPADKEALAFVSGGDTS